MNKVVDFQKNSSCPSILILASSIFLIRYFYKKRNMIKIEYSESVEFFRTLKFLNQSSSKRILLIYKMQKFYN